MLIVFALLATATLADVNTNCYSFNSSVSAVYEIEDLYNSTSDYYLNTSSGVLRYNFCNQLVGSSNASNTTYNTSAVLLRSDNSTARLTNGTIPKFLVQNTSNPLSGLYLVYPGGDVVPGTNATYNYTVVLACVPNSSYNATSVNDTNGNFTVYASGERGCPIFAFYQLANFVEKYRYIFIITGVVIGIFVGFFGLRLFKPTIFLTTFVTVFLLMAFVLFTFALGNNPSNGSQWGCLVGALAIGVLAGILLVKLEKVGIFFLGASLGTTGSFLLYTLIINHLKAGQVLLILFTVASALICGLVALFIYEHVIIISTAVTGAYLAVRGVSLFAPHQYAYPSEIDIAKQIQYNGVSNLPGIFYLYFSLIVVFAIAGGFIQYRHKKSRDEEKAQEEITYPGLAYHAHP